MIARSVAVPSRVTRIVSYIFFEPLSSTASDYLPCGSERLGQPVKVHGGDQDSTRPTRSQQEAAILPSSHSLFGTGELQQGKHCEWKLQGKDNLAESKQIGNATVATQADDENCGKNGQRTGDKASHPGLDPPMHEAFHHDLPGQRPSDCAALPTGQKSHGKQRAC